MLLCMLAAKMGTFPRSWCARMTLTSCVLILCLSWCNGLSVQPFANTFVAGAPGYNCTRNSVCNETRLCPPGCPCILNGIPCLSGSVCTQLQGFSGLFCLCPTNKTLNTTTNSCVNSTVTQPANAAPSIVVVNTRRDAGTTSLTGARLRIAGGPTAGVNATIRSCRQTSNPNDDGETRRLNLRVQVTNGVVLASCNIALVETYLDVASRRNFRQNNFCTKRDFLFNNRPNRVTTTKFVGVNLRNGRFILTSGPPEGPRRGYIVQRYNITCTSTNGLTSSPVEFFVAFPSCRACAFQRNADNCPIANGRAGRNDNCKGPPDGPPSQRSRLPCLAFYTANGAEPQDCTRLYLNGERPANRVAALIRSSSWKTPDSDREDIIDSVPKDVQPDGVATSSQQEEEDLDDEEETASETTRAPVQKPEDVDDDDEDAEGVTTTERPQQVNSDNDDDKDDNDEE